MADESYLYWAKKGRPDLTHADTQSDYNIRTYADRMEFKKTVETLSEPFRSEFPDIELFAERFTSSFERMFLFDTVSWSSLSFKLQNDTTLPFDSMPYKGPFKFAAIQSGLDAVEAGAGKELKYCGETVLISNAEMGAWVPKEGKGMKRWCDMFVLQIAEAIEGKANVICAGEFAWPATKYEKDLDDRIRVELKKSKEPVFLIAGSRHFPLEKVTPKSKIHSNENIGMIYTVDPRNNAEVEFARRHAKKSPAIRIGERLFTENSDCIKSYRTPFGNFGVLICSDAFDLRILMSYLRDNPGSSPNRTGVIFVPSYNNSPILRESCRYLSYLANCVVVYVNSAMEDFEKESVKFYIAGFEDRDVSPFIRKHDSFFGPDAMGFDSLIEWHSFDDRREAIINCGGSGAPKELKRSVLFYDINTVIAQNFCSNAAIAGGALLEASIKKEEGQVLRK